MSPHHRELHTTISHPDGDVTRFGFNPLSTTRTCNTVADAYM
jgi:hypothetical protein